MLTKENLYSILLLVRAIRKLRQVHARVAQLVEHDLAKVGVAGSSPVSRSILQQKDIRRMSFLLQSSPAGARRFEVSAPLRSAQSRRPPDVLRRLALLLKSWEALNKRLPDFFVLKSLITHDYTSNANTLKA